MQTSTLIIVNFALSTLAILGVAGLVRLAHRLPSAAPHEDESWGRSGDPWVESDPLPLRELITHESERELLRAA